MNGMRKKLLVVGVALVAVSAVAATQYARADLEYTYNINHPSNGFIRFVGGDNATDGERILQADSSNQTLKLDFGDMTAGVNKTYTAAFAIVNEENFSVDITNVTVTTAPGDTDNMQIWLHDNPDAKAEDDPPSVLVWNKGDTAGTWTMGEGNSDPADMDGGNIATSWDDTAHVRYTEATTPADANDDYVWVQISLDIPSGASTGESTGTITFDFQASTH